MALHHPGGRVVVVVGAGHKAFFDDYLDRMLDVDLVQLAEVLEATGPEDAPAIGVQAVPAGRRRAIADRTDRPVVLMGGMSHD